MILNRQRRVRVPVRDLNVFVEQTCRALRLPSQAFTVCLVPEDEMARWNLAYRGKSGPTDVLSFPSEKASRPPRKQTRAPKHPRRSRETGNGDVASPPAGDPAYLGDIAIAPAVARRNARQFDRTFPDEMRILILHGILHLQGYDHETDNGQMDRREHRLRRLLGLA